MRYEVLSITTGGEAVVESHADLDAAFDACEKRWSGRKAGSAIYAVRDADTEQRWSYRDIQDLRSEESDGERAERDDYRALSDDYGYAP